jgi:hypothetical protein
MNKGQEQLQGVALSLQKVSDALATKPSKVQVGEWRRGESLPSHPNRIALRDAFAIPVNAWDQSVASAAPPAHITHGDPGAAPDATEGPPDDPTMAEGLRRTIARIERRIDRLERDPDANESALAPLYATLTSAMQRLARLTGEGDLTIPMIVKSKAWREVLDIIDPILTEHPEVAEKIALALEAAQ